MNRTPQTSSVHRIHVAGMHDELDLNGGECGKYAVGIVRRGAMVVLEPDVADTFPMREDVSRAPRAILEAEGPGDTPTAL